MTNSVKGTLCGILAAVSYGTNPLFSLRLYAAGMTVESVLFYRFFFATIVLGVILKMRHVDLSVTLREFIYLFIAGVVFALSSLTLYQSFLYIDAGIACSILFVYPMMVAVMMVMFFHERASALTFGCIITSLVGIVLLYYKGGGMACLDKFGLLMVVLSSLCYSVYIVGVDHSMLKYVPSSKMTFWGLVSGTLLFFCMTGGWTHLQPVPANYSGWLNTFGMAIFPTVLPIFFINIAIKNIGPTYSAIIGALEPVTALMIGVLVFHEVVTPRIVFGISLILFSVMVLLSSKLSFSPKYFLVHVFHHRSHPHSRM